MKKKKKNKKRKPDSVSKLTQEEKELLDSALLDPKQISADNIKNKIYSPAFVCALVENLPIKAPDASNLILTIREAYDHKEVQKAIKKTLFRLKQKGIQIEEPVTQKGSKSIISRIEKEEPQVYLSPIDGTGSRGVLVMLPQIPKGVDVGIGAISYEEGLIDFITNRTSKKQANELKNYFFEQAGKPVETSLSHAATLLENAYKNNQGTTSENIKGYLEIRPKILNNTALLERAAIYDFLTPDELTDEVLTESRIRKLLDHELLNTWMISPDKIRPLLEKLSEAENSLILVTEEQKAGRVKEIKDKELFEIFPGSKQMELKGMLEEMSYVFLKQEEEDFARLALLASLSLERDDTSLGVNTFLEAFLEHSLKFYRDMTGNQEESTKYEDDSPSSIIIP